MMRLDLPDGQKIVNTDPKEDDDPRLRMASYHGGVFLMFDGGYLVSIDGEQDLVALLTGITDALQQCQQYGHR